MMKQFPAPGSFCLKWAGDLFEVSLELDAPLPGRAVFRTNIGRASVHRRELIAYTESGEPVLARDWHDIPMREVSPGRFQVRIPLTEVGIFAGKACFFPKDNGTPLWPDGENLQVKVEPACTACGNTMYTAFVRQFGASIASNPRTPDVKTIEIALDTRHYTVIPPSGTFRDLIGRLDSIMGTMRFRIIQLLPVFPTPTTYGRMGRFGSAFAATDFLSVDPSLAVFDKGATPLDQFRELVDAVHSRAGFLYLDLPANHTGWAATLQTHHPDWYRREPDGTFISPGAWGVTWADLVELDYRDPRLCAYMADVFLFWCGQGVDGFRCDAGYMIPAETWTYIVARVRESYPDTVFMLEGLGGKVSTTESLLSSSNLNWAYSELFQTEGRGAMEAYLPKAIALSERCGPLIHFAETHDNNRLASRGKAYSRMRVALSALLSDEGAFGMANGVEWFATEKIDVHGASGLNWGAPDNQIAAIARLNTLLAKHPAFGPDTRLEMVQQGDGDVLAVLRRHGARSLLVLANFDCEHPQVVHWPAECFTKGEAWDVLSGDSVPTAAQGFFALTPGRVCCLTADPADCSGLDDLPLCGGREPLGLAVRARNLMAFRVREWVGGRADDSTPDALGAALASDPLSFCAKMNGTDFAPCSCWDWPMDLHRRVMVPDGHLLLLRSDRPFKAELLGECKTFSTGISVLLDDGRWALFLSPAPAGNREGRSSPVLRTVVLTIYAPSGIERKSAEILTLPSADAVRVLASVSGRQVREDLAACDSGFCANRKPAEAFTPFMSVLSNGAGAMSYVRAAWGAVRSQYDCLLGLNLDPNVPAEKIIFWTRCRAWLRYRGYSQEINQSCMSRFTVDPAGRFAVWSFKVPCGMGCWAPLAFRLDAVPSKNLVSLSISRGDAPEGLDDREPVTVILRPDIEWRSFYNTTKAFLGPEKVWPSAVRSQADGFAFCPEGAPAGLGMRLEGGAFHLGPEWTYNVPHPEEAERGQDGAGDLFSPGWFDATLWGGVSCRVVAGVNPSEEVGISRLFPGVPENAEPLPVSAALSQALSLFIVKRDAFKTVIAGYPWFLDWGRDTLIVLRGMIADGRLEESLSVLREFGRFEENGTLPNIIHGNSVGNRDTSDAPLWFCVAAGDLADALGPAAVLDARCGNRPLREIVLSILSHFRDGTPNGVKMDSASGLLFSPVHFTWMDTNYPAGTPREGYPVGIQALWIAALRLAAKRIAPSWAALADQAAASLGRLFALPEGGLTDCLRAKPGVPAAQAQQEDAVRPNQLLAVTLGVLTDRGLARSIVNVCERLLVPGAIRSIADQPTRIDFGIWRDGVLLNDPHAPYQGHYRGDEDTRRKPAYHNGTAWSWQFPLYAEACFRLYGESARAFCASLLTSSVEELNRGGCLCQIAEVFDGDAPHLARGCGAQAWGISELLRVWRLLMPSAEPDWRG